MIAHEVTHTSVAITKELIGRSEFFDWIAYFQIIAEKRKAAEDAASKRQTIRM